MKVHFILTVLSIILISYNCSAQVSYNSIGSDYVNQAGAISFSIGEICYEHKGIKYILTEGIQNGITINANKKNDAIDVSVFPNPTSGLIFFKVLNLYYNKLAYSLYNELGEELMNGIITSESNSVSLKRLPAAIYLIKIYRDMKLITTYQVIKIN